jgi:hypothetical protein
MNTAIIINTAIPKIRITCSHQRQRRNRLDSGGIDSGGIDSGGIDSVQLF